MCIVPRVILYFSFPLRKTFWHSFRAPSAAEATKLSPTFEKHQLMKKSPDIFLEASKFHDRWSIDGDIYHPPVDVEISPTFDLPNDGEKQKIHPLGWS